jgi:hypothetical protein
MKFSLATLSLLVGVSCAHNDPTKVSKPQENASFSPADLDRLERQELDRPGDPDIKWQLSLVHLCQGQLGLAFEKWLWIEQFAPQSPHHKRAQQLLEDSELRLRAPSLCQELVGSISDESPHTLERRTDNDKNSQK